MHIEFVTVTGEKVMAIGTDFIFPVKGDILSAPDGRIFIIVQRTFIARAKAPAPGKLVDLSAPREADITMQCLLQPVEPMEGDNAIKS